MFFRQHIRTIPRVNSNFWSFAITGSVRHPLILSYDDLRALPAQTVRCAIACSAASSDQPLIGEADWRGVPLRALLDRLIVDPAAQFARVHAADGYTTVLPLDRLAVALLAYEMDGTPLPLEHGFPARLIAPGLHGYKMPKWIERVELSDSPDGGFWETRGGSLDGAVAIKVALLSHEQAADGSLVLAGIAYAGERAIHSVQISIDGGGWMPVSFTPGAPAALTHWQIDWTPPDAGDYQVAVVAHDASGSAKTSLVLRIR